MGLYVHRNHKGFLGTGPVKGFARIYMYIAREPVWPSGKALGWSAEGPWFDPLRLSFILKLCGLWTLSRDFAHTMNEALKSLPQLPALMQSHYDGGSVASKC